MALDPAALIHSYGLWALFLLVFLESTGIPLPGETALIAAGLYAGATHHVPLWAVILVAFAAAVTGDMMGYAIGRRFGYRLLHRHGRHFGITERRLRIGEYLFLRHGGKIVFAGRFVALLRVLTALLAGVHRMIWPRFALMNALGGLCWASLFGTAAYVFGDRVSRIERPLALGLLVLVLVGIVAAFLFGRRYEQRLAEEAERAFEKH
ncbi:MAG TPA: DedA family protein [Allosphingosinicella sp.]|jgi:membrane protein DedA with SNARE-associated domain